MTAAAVIQYTTNGRIHYYDIVAVLTDSEMFHDWFDNAFMGCYDIDDFSWETVTLPTNVDNVSPIFIEIKDDSTLFASCESIACIYTCLTDALASRSPHNEIHKYVPGSYPGAYVSIDNSP